MYTYQLLIMLTFIRVYWLVYYSNILKLFHFKQSLKLFQFYVNMLNVYIIFHNIYSRKQIFRLIESLIPYNLSLVKPLTSNKTNEKHDLKLDQKEKISSRVDINYMLSKSQCFFTKRMIGIGGSMMMGTGWKKVLGTCNRASNCFR